MARFFPDFIDSAFFYILHKIYRQTLKFIKLNLLLHFRGLISFEEVQSYEVQSHSRFGHSRFGPILGSVLFEVRSFEVRSLSRFGHSRFGPIRGSVIRGSVIRGSVF